MYIIINSQKYECELSNIDFDNYVVFSLLDKPKIEGDLIELYSSDNKLIKILDRRNYLNEKITNDNGIFYYLLSNYSDEEILNKNVQLKINKLKTEATNKIQFGIDFLINNIKKHFSFDITDQLNLIMICQYLFEHPEVETYRYHADGEDLMAYDREVLFSLRNAMLEHITQIEEQYHKDKKQIENS